MAYIASAKKLRLPRRVAQIIQVRNSDSVLTELEQGLWVLEGSSLFVYSSWFQQNNFPPPWDKAVYQLVKRLAWGDQLIEYPSSFFVADKTINYVNLPLTPDLQSFIDELSIRYTLDPREVILGLLHQAYDCLVK